MSTFKRKKSKLASSKTIEFRSFGHYNLNILSQVLQKHLIQIKEETGIEMNFGTLVYDDISFSTRLTGIISGTKKTFKSNANNYKK